MKSFKVYIEENAKKEAFIKRFNLHTGLVKKYAGKIASAFPEFSDVIDRAEVHDKSKLSEPELGAYIELQHFYDQKKKGIKVKYNPELNNIIAHHVKTNSHHPEFHDINVTGKIVNSKNPANAENMPKLDMAEMCADLCAMSEELGGTPMKFYSDNINKRWKFTDEQQKFMLNIMKRIWK